MAPFDQVNIWVALDSHQNCKKAEAAEAGDHSIDSFDRPGTQDNSDSCSLHRLDCLVRIHTPELKSWSI